jgi:hypothetical protein
MKMDHLARSVGLRRNEGQGKHGRRTDWKSLVSAASRNRETLAPVTHFL